MKHCSSSRSCSARLIVLCAIGALIGAAAPAAAQTQFVPYFGKNQIRYDNFEWQIYTTDHFEIYYYPAIEPHLEKIAGYAESAYQHVSSELKHDLAFKVPLILFSTSSEFFQQNVIPGAAQEGVGAFAEPSRYRIVMPMDEPSDLLYRLTVHELTHQFQYDIIPTSLIRSNMPLWVFEGMSDYMTGVWRSIDLMTVRDAAVADIVPKMSELQGYGNFGNVRLIYNLGHAAFEFIEARWGKEGVRQFVFSLRKSVIGGGDNAFKEAFDMDADEWDQQFDRYLKDRFKPFRDKERPADYGRDLAPNPEKTRFSSVLSVEPSPSGDLIAAMTGNRRDREYDIVLLSAKDGQVIRNLTSGFDQSLGFEYIPTPGMRFNTVPWMSWAPQGDRIAYFVRTEKDRSLLLQNVISRKVEERIPMTTVDSPESPDISPDGRVIAFAAARGVVNDIFTINLATREVVNLTNDAFADYAPTWSPDGKSIVFLKRVSGNEKLFRLDLDSGKSSQLTFGTHDEGGAQFLDADTLLFTSTATDPAKAIDPEVARNGVVHNIWTPPRSPAPRSRRAGTARWRAAVPRGAGRSRRRRRTRAAAPRRTRRAGRTAGWRCRPAAAPPAVAHRDARTRCRPPSGRAARRSGRRGRRTPPCRARRRGRGRPAPPIRSCGRRAPAWPAGPSCRRRCRARPGNRPGWKLPPASNGLVRSTRPTTTTPSCPRPWRSCAVSAPPSTTVSQCCGVQVRGSRPSIRCTAEPRWSAAPR